MTDNEEPTIVKILVKCGRANYFRKLLLPTKFILELIMVQSFSEADRLYY